MKSSLLAVCFFITISMYAQENPEQRIAHYTLEINLHPDSAQNYINRGIAYNDSKDYTAAITDCNKALKLYPQNKRALKIRAYSYYWQEKYDSSIQDLNEVLQLDNSDAAAWDQRGLDYYWLNKLDNSISDFSEALHHDPANALFWFNRGNSYYWLRNYDKAIGDFSESITYNAENIRPFYIRGLCYYYSKKYRDAVNDFNLAYKIDPLNDDVLNARGNCYEMVDQEDSALADFSKALKINPANSAAWNNRGNAYKRKQNYDLAIADYIQAILLNPKNSDAIFNRGNVYLLLKKPEEAIADFNEVLKIETPSAKVLGSRGDAYVMAGKYELAIADYNKALEIDPKNNEVYTALGICYKKMGKKELALKNFNEGVQLNPASLYSVVNRGDFYSSVHDYDAAIKDYSEAININPQAYEARNNRGNLFFNQKKYDLAASDYTIIISQNPNTATGYSNRGYVYKFQKKYGLAIADLSKAVSLEPSSYISWDKLGAVYMDMFQYDSALIYINKALRLNASDTNTLNDRALCYSNKKKYDEAVADFKKALEINPNFTNALNNRALVYYKRGEYDLAIKDLKKGIQVKPFESRLFINCILVYLASDKLNEAAELYTQYKQQKLSSYIDEFSEWSFLKNYISACCDYLIKKDYEKAMQLLQTSLEDYKETNQNVNPGVSISMEYSNVLIKIAFINEALNQQEKALEYYKTALVISPQLTAINSKVKALSGKLQKEAKLNGTPPQIQLLTPATTRSNAVEVVNNSNDIFISGTVKDNAGVSWVKINGKDVTLQPGGYFSADIKSNVSSFTIQSANANNLISTVTYNVETSGATKSNADDIPAIAAAAPPRFHAILIACSNYSGDKWKKLPSTKDEAIAYKDVLEKYYGFKKEDVLEVFDKDRRDILNLLSSSIQSLDSNDNLIILFAGHGTYIKGNDNMPVIGYWVPLNAENPADYISNGNLSDIIYGSKTRHILFISDACYSAAMRGSDEFDRLSAKDEWVFTSRQILTSGGLAKVPAESVFIKMVIKALEINDQKVLSAKALYNIIFTGVKNQTDDEPELNTFGHDGNEGGQFYFIKQ